MYRDSLEQAELAGRLQVELSEATRRGARLCADSRRVVSALRNWAAGLKDQHRLVTRGINNTPDSFSTNKGEVD